MTADDYETSRTVTFTAAVSGAATTPIVADVQYDAAVFSSVAISPVAAGYAVAARTLANVPVGTRSGTIQFRLCQETACTNVYPQTVTAHTVSLTVKLGQWSTYQRDAGHTGYVPVTLDPAKFSKGWEQTIPEVARFGGVATSDGALFVTAGSKAYRLNEGTGAIAWTYTGPPSSNLLGPPGVQNNVVYFATRLPTTGPISNDDAVIRSVNAASGVEGAETPFRSLADKFNSPTFFDGAMYFTDRQIVYRLEWPGPVTAWARTLPGGINYSAHTPAVDANYVYHASGVGVFIVNRADGALVASVPNPTISGGGGVTAPVLAAGKVLTTDMSDNSRLIAINPTTQTIAWRGPGVGIAQPVAAGSTVYAWTAGPGDTAQVSAIDAATGGILWSWPMPAGDTRLIEENMVVTNNLLFLSTNRSLYAIDLATHQTVWSYPTHGKLALSANLVLYVLQSDFGVTSSKILTFRLAG